MYRLRKFPFPQETRGYCHRLSIYISSITKLQARYEPAETSGYPRPVTLNFPLFVVPCRVKNAWTADAWYEGRANVFEKPPPLGKLDTAVSPAGLMTVAPTVVTLLDFVRPNKQK